MQDYVSIPSLAGQTARLVAMTMAKRRRPPSFNPLISGADRAAGFMTDPIEADKLMFQSPH